MMDDERERFETVIRSLKNGVDKNRMDAARARDEVTLLNKRVFELKSDLADLFLRHAAETKELKQEIFNLRNPRTWNAK